MTAERFITPDVNNESPRDRFRKTMADILETDVQNVDVFTMRDVPVQEVNQGMEEGIDVRYSAHGSPYYRSARLDGLVWMNKDKVRGPTPKC